MAIRSYATGRAARFRTLIKVGKSLRRAVTGDRDRRVKTASNRQVDSGLSRQRFVLPEPVLDIGCGDGRFFRLLFPDCQDVVGVELDQGTARNALDSGVYRDVHVMAADALPATAERFGSAFANCSLEHMDNLHGVLSGIHASLQPGAPFRAGARRRASRSPPEIRPLICWTVPEGNGPWAFPSLSVAIAAARPLHLTAVACTCDRGGQARPRDDGQRRRFHTPSGDRCAVRPWR